MSQAISDMAVTWADGTLKNGIKLNVTDTSSNASSLLMDLGTGGGSFASKFNVTKAGKVVITGTPNAAAIIESATQFRTGAIQIGVDVAGGSAFAVGASIAVPFGVWGTNGLIAGGTQYIGWSPSGFAAPDTVLFRDGAANTLAQRNGANGQTFRLYGRYTDGSNYERFYVSAPTTSGDTVLIGTDKLGVGSAARSLAFQTDGVTRLTIGTTGNVTFNGQVTVSTASNVFTINQGTGAGGIFSLYHFASSVGASCRSDAYWGWSSTTSADATADVVMKRGGAGILTLGNAATITDFNRLQFGGTTSSFPALKRDTTTLQARLADDSAFTNIQGKLTTEANAVAETPTATHTLTIYDAAGTAYKVLAVAA